MKDDELAKALRTQTKELHKLCGKLKTDGLIKTESVPEYFTQGGKERRKFTRTFYYIDYKNFVDVVKWRIFQIGRKIEKEVQDLKTRFMEESKSIIELLKETDMMKIPRYVSKNDLNGAGSAPADSTNGSIESGTSASTIVVDFGDGAPNQDHGMEDEEDEFEWQMSAASAG
ncbi:hypothetical protein HDV00_011130 [Rhizophlyctis rosea]|nr:hypothetical protein HDV00_011130 [Rhizophlyctis rosea]